MSLNLFLVQQIELKHEIMNECRDIKPCGVLYWSEMKVTLPECKAAGVAPGDHCTTGTHHSKTPRLKDAAVSHRKWSLIYIYHNTNIPSN